MFSNITLRREQLPEANSPETLHDFISTNIHEAFLSPYSVEVVMDNAEPKLATSSVAPVFTEPNEQFFIPISNSLFGLEIDLSGIAQEEVHILLSESHHYELRKEDATFTRIVLPDEILDAPEKYPYIHTRYGSAVIDDVDPTGIYGLSREQLHKAKNSTTIAIEMNKTGVHHAVTQVELVDPVTTRKYTVTLGSTGASNYIVDPKTLEPMSSGHHSLVVVGGILLGTIGKSVQLVELFDKGDDDFTGKEYKYSRAARGIDDKHLMSDDNAIPNAVPVRVDQCDGLVRPLAS